MNEIIDFFLEPYRTATALDISLEILAVIFGVASVWFAKKESIWVYPTGIISTAIYVYICYQFTLYGDLIINIYYTLMSIYGWYMWTKLIQGEHIEITKSSKKDILKAIGIFISTAVFVVCVYLYFNRFDRITDYFDTFTTGIFFAAMWMMANKKIEHWLLWIGGNIISIPLYFIKGLGFSGIQFTIFLVLAILGYIEWKKNLNNNQQTA
ncbi:nicotinamide riboside transporter PnuC [Flavobacteriaceae bacterium S0825]|uniref:nicotinamide riboside transporter PnuC n=1 Tax=Gaetbulibacter sp. S0825 TaxID=2720084 RepID=UPI00142F75D1|nr:nicotinamide riboside transporter PnuC [Gaetbulibacter sp. S0825]MCK0107985.1 nicotinamide riboside transporter PnuC [Flavobacteriaceae bacterium S0825]NIX63621.1 nicotinamide mononucleotide transporter [Gaetbulibacter sp. S0825]